MAKWGLAAFGRWLISPSWVMLACAGLVVAACVAALLGPDDLPLSLQRQLSGGDLYGGEELRLYNQVSLLKGVARDPLPVIAYIGGSTTRESLLSEVALEQAITRQGGPQARVFALASSAQDMVTSWSLAEVTACAGADLVIIGINQNRLGNPAFNHPIDETGHVGPDLRAFVGSGALTPRLATISSQLTTDWRSRISLFLEVADSWLARELTLSEENLRKNGLHRYIGRERGDPERSLGAIEARRAGGTMTGEYLKRAKQSIERCGADMLVLISAIHPLALDPGRYPRVAAAEPLVRRLVSEAGVPPERVLDLQQLNLPAEAFFDWGHLITTEAMRETTEALAWAIAPLLRSEAP